MATTIQWQLSLGLAVMDAGYSDQNIFFFFMWGLHSALSWLLHQLRPLSLSFAPPHLPYSFQYIHLQMSHYESLRHFFVLIRGLLLNYSSSTFCNLKRSFQCAMIFTSTVQCINLINIHDTWHNYCLKNVVHQSLSHILKIFWVKRQFNFYFSEEIPYFFS